MCVNSEEGGGWLSYRPMCPCSNIADYIHHCLMTFTLKINIKLHHAKCNMKTIGFQTSFTLSMSASPILVTELSFWDN